MNNKFINAVLLLLITIAWPVRATEVVDIDCNSDKFDFYQVFNRYLQEDHAKNFMITGHCTTAQPVVIFKDNISLTGRDQRSTISGGLIITNGVSNVKIRHLNLQGDFAALIVSNNAFATVSDSKISQSARGISAFYGGTVRVINSSIRNNVQGLVVGTNGNAILEGSNLEHNQLGAQLFANGIVTLEQEQPSGQPSIVRDNIDGIYASFGGIVRPVNAIFSHNQQKAIAIFDNGMLFLSEPYTVQISDNHIGIDIDNTVVPDLLKADITFANNQQQDIACGKIWHNDPLKALVSHNKTVKVAASCLN